MRVLWIVGCLVVLAGCYAYALYARRTRLPELRAALEEYGDDPQSDSAGDERG